MFRYRYQKKINHEIACIRRVQQLQQRMVALMGTAIASLFISMGTFASRVLYAVLYEDGHITAASDAIAGAGLD